MEIKRRRWLWGMAVVSLFLVTTGSFAFGQAVQIRWDIVSIDFAAGTVRAGGVSAALANDGSQIVFTGTGTFVPATGAADGGGTWATSGPVGSARGMYRVTGLVRWELAPGTPPPLQNLILNAAHARAGLAVLQIAYSDGSQGVLTVSCHLIGTPDSVFEGVTASKGFVTFWERGFPVDGSDVNRTLFHIL